MSRTMTDIALVREIKTEFWGLSIFRNFIWTAQFADDADDGPLGFGSTEREAVKNLLARAGQEQRATGGQRNGARL